MEFVDIHGHYAWGIDDGIRDRDEAIKALKVAKDNGITEICATPHVVSGTTSKEDIAMFLERIDELRTIARDMYGMTVHQGGEVFLNHDCIRQVKDEIFIPYDNTKYVLCEFDVRKQLPEDEDEVEDYLYNIKVRGYTPVVAHVERYFKDYLDLDRLEEWFDEGYVLQVNAPSLLGIQGSTIKKNAYDIIDAGLAHFIASDSHRAEGHRCPTTMMQAYNALSKDYDRAVIQTLMHDNPLCILNGEPVADIPEKKRGFFAKLWRR